MASSRKSSNHPLDDKLIDSSYELEDQVDDELEIDPFLKKMGEALNQEKYQHIIDNVSPLVSPLVEEIESTHPESYTDKQADQNTKRLLHYYSFLEEAYRGLGDEKNAKIYQLNSKIFINYFIETCQSYGSIPSQPVSEAKETKIEIPSTLDSHEEVIVLFNRIEDLIDRYQYAEALPLLRTLKPLVINQSEDKIFEKVFCLHSINLCFHELTMAHGNRNEIQQNFQQVLETITHSSSALIQKLGFPKYIEKADHFYSVHTKIFLGYSLHSASSLSQRTDAFKSFIICGIRGIKINQKNDLKRKFYINLLNSYASVKYHLTTLSDPISKEHLQKWEEQIDKKIDPICSTAEYLYAKAVEIIINKGAYTKTARVYLEKAIEKYRSDKEFNINQIKANILLARCYAEVEVKGGVKSLNAAISQITALKPSKNKRLKKMPEVPELWSLHLEYGLALLTENNNIKGAINEFEKALKFKNYFDPDKDFFKLNSTTILQLIAEHLMESTIEKTPTPDYKDGLKSFFNILIKLNEKPKDESVYACLAEAYANLGQLAESKLYLEKVSDVGLRQNILTKHERTSPSPLSAKKSKKEVEKTTVKPDKKPEVPLKQPILKKTPEQIKAEKEQEEELRKKEQARQTWAKVKAQREQEETQKKLEEARQALAKIKEEAEAKKREAFRLRQIDKQKNKNKDEGFSQHELEGTPVPLSDKQQRRLQREKEKPTSSISSSIASGRGNGAKGLTKKPKSTGKKKVPGKTKQERDEEFRAEEEATRKMRIVQQQKAAEALAKEEKVKEEKQRENTEKYKVEESHRLEMLKQKQEETRKAEEARRLEIEKLEKETEERRKAEEEAHRLEMEKQEKEAEERRKAEEEARRLEMEKQEKAMEEKRKTEKKEEKNIVTQVHSGLIDVALALHHKKDPHKAIDDNAILKQLKELNDKLKTNPLLKDLKLELIIQGTAVLEFYLARKKGEKINFDASDLDLFIYNAPKKHTAKKHKKLTEAEKKENEAYNQLQTILTASGFNRLVRKHDSHHFSNYTHAEHPKLQLTVAHDTYQSNDPFYFTRGRIRFSDKDGLELVNPKELASTEEMMLECDLVKADSPNIVNFFSRLLKYYEKGQNNNFKFGKNFIKALENPWQFHFFLTKYNEGEQHSNYLEMQSVIKSGFLDTQKTLPKTFAAAKGLLSAFCEAAYYAKFKAKNIGLCSLIRDLLIIYYANKGSNPELLLTDLNFLIKNEGVFYQPFIYKALTTYYAKEDTGQISLHSDLQFLTQQGIQPQHSSVEYLVSELERKNNPAKFMKNYSMNEDSFADMYSAPLSLPVPQSSFNLGMFSPPPTVDSVPMPHYALASPAFSTPSLLSVSGKQDSLLVRTSLFSPTATTECSTPSTSSRRGFNLLSPGLSQSESDE